MKVINLSQTSTPTRSLIIQEVCSEILSSLKSLNKDKKYRDHYLDIIAQRGCGLDEFTESLGELEEFFEDLRNNPNNLSQIEDGVEKSLFTTALLQMEGRWNKPSHGEVLTSLWKTVLLSNLDKPKLKIV